MVTERQMRLGIGLFVAGAMILLGTLIVLFRSLPRYFRPGTEYTVVFTEAPGVDVGTPVRKSGIRIGEVTSVHLDDETGSVRVGIMIDPRFTIRRNDQPTLVSGVLGGDVTIDFVPLEPPPAPQPPTPAPAAPPRGAAPKGDPHVLPVQFRQPPQDVPPARPAPIPPDHTPVPPGAVLQGTRQPGVTTVVPATQETMNDIRRSLQRLERMSPLMEETMREYRDLAREARTNIPDLRRTNDELRELSKAAREAVPELRRTNDEVGATARAWGRLGERLDVLVQANQEKVVKAVENLNEALTRVNSVLSEENQRNLTTTLKNLRSASDSFTPIAKNTEDITREGRTTVRRMNDTLTDVQKVTRPLGERGDRIARNLDESLEKLNRTLGDTNTLIGAIGKSDGTVSRLLTDPTLYNRLDEILCAVQKSQPRLDRILRDFETFSDKIARHPEQLGVRGAVRPDSGIK